jgi:polar amino acid transport system substrate-binding protein
MRAAIAAILLIFAGAAEAADVMIAPTGTLRAVYLGGNPAQGIQNTITGEVRGVVGDLTRELGKRITPVAGVQAVIEAVRDGRADIGFIAYDASRTGTVEFSQTYMLVKQTFLVLKDSALRTVEDLDRPGVKVGAGRGDSIALFIRRNFERATIVEGADPSPATAKQMLSSKAVDAFGGNRQRLTTVAREDADYRVLEGDIFGVPQAIIVPKGKPSALIAVNRFIDEMRASEFLAASIAPAASSASRWRHRRTGSATSATYAAASVRAKLASSPIFAATGCSALSAVSNDGYCMTRSK